MAFNYSKLEGRIREVCKTNRAFAEQIGLSEHSVSYKLSGKSPWKHTEIYKACEVLGISDGDIPLYFFVVEVQ